MYHNPFRRENIFSIVLKEKSDVTIELFNKIGEKLYTILKKQQLSEGKQEIKMTRSQLKSGMYIAKITVDNSKGTFTEDLKVLIN